MVFYCISTLINFSSFQFIYTPTKSQQQSPRYKDPKIMLKKPQRSDEHYKQALGNSGKKELHFNRKLAPQMCQG